MNEHEAKSSERTERGELAEAAADETRIACEDEAVEENESVEARIARLEALTSAQRVVIEHQAEELAALRDGDEEGETPPDGADEDANGRLAPDAPHTMSPRPMAASRRERARCSAAAEAMRTGRRQDLLRYLRLRRTA